MFLKRFVTSSLRNQLFAGFLVVIVAFAIAVVIATSAISSVSSSVRKGYTTAAISSESGAAAQNMAASELANMFSGGKDLTNHKADVAAFGTVATNLLKTYTTPARKALAKRLGVAYYAWLAVDKQSIQLAAKGPSPALTQFALGPVNSTADALTNSLKEYAQLLRQEANSKSSSATSSKTTLVIVLALIAFVAALVIGWLLSRG
ncbi:MAG TPA: hypothetical protein VFD88_12145, partial [Clostridia bacterium]|nr:hypothetical protein [Clostridia bacterium]